MKLLKPESRNFLGSFNTSFEPFGVYSISSVVFHFSVSPAGILHSTVSGERSITHRTSKYFFYNLKNPQNDYLSWSIYGKLSAIVFLLFVLGY